MEKFTGNVEIVDTFTKQKKHQKYVLFVNIHNPTLNFGKKIIKNSHKTYTDKALTKN